MIKFKLLISSSLNFNEQIEKYKSKIPLHIIWYDKEEWYTIPNITKTSFTYHREDGPAKINNWRKIKPGWYWYGSKAASEQEWLNPEWRKKAELKIFI